MNHYAKFCRSKEVHNLEEVEDSDPEEEESEEELPLFCVLIGIKQCVGRRAVLYETVEKEGAQVRFQLDSGSKANVMSAKVYSNLRSGSPPPLKKTNTMLISFSKQKPNGEVKLRFNDQVEDVRFFVVLS